MSCPFNCNINDFCETFCEVTDGCLPDLDCDCPFDCSLDGECENECSFNSDCAFDGDCSGSFIEVPPAVIAVLVVCLLGICFGIGCCIFVCVRLAMTNHKETQQRPVYQVGVMPDGSKQMIPVNQLVLQPTQALPRTQSTPIPKAPIPGQVGSNSFTSGQADSARFTHGQADSGSYAPGQADSGSYAPGQVDFGNFSHGQAGSGNILPVASFNSNDITQASLSPSRDTGSGINRNPTNQTGRHSFDF